MLDGIIARIRDAHASGTPLEIRGHGSKSHWGNPACGEVLDTTALTGIVDYQPNELVLTARAGIPLRDVEAALATHGQLLPFEPPHFGAAGTLGGAVASGLCGPRRMRHGAVRDAVLGVSLIDGSGQVLRFGGRVIKNVAGYDVSRLMAGALGTLGVLTEVSLKVMPRPASTCTLQFSCDQADALLRMQQWAGQPLPLSATSWHNGALRVRVSGAVPAVQAACRALGGEMIAAGDAFWHALRDQTLPFFAQRPVWRLAVRPTAPPLPLDTAPWIEWGGGLRWYAGAMSAAAVRAIARDHGGHAALFRGAALADGNFAPQAPAVTTLQRALKQRFDPAAILNRGRLFPEP